MGCNREIGRSGMVVSMTGLVLSTFLNTRLVFPFLVFIFFSQGNKLCKGGRVNFSLGKILCVGGFKLSGSSLGKSSPIGGKSFSIYFSLGSSS